MSSIVIQLDEKSIDKAIQWAKEQQSKIEETINGFIQLLLNKGVQIAKKNVKNIDTGETLKSIEGMMYVNNRGTKGVIVAGGHAVWLEFGTGIDKHTSYPDPLPSGTTDGTHQIAPPKQSTSGGWYFPAAGTKWDLGNGYGFTHGIEPNRFMYEAKKYLIQNAPQWANDMFSDL